MSDIMFNKYQTPQSSRENSYCVYRHINSQNGKVYVGITKMSLSARWGEGRGYKKCKLFYRAIQKYGWNNLQHHVVCKNHWRNYKIIQYKDNQLINIFDSFRDAERSTGIQHTLISHNVDGKSKHAGGYVWKKIREEDLHGYKI